MATVRWTSSLPRTAAPSFSGASHIQLAQEQRKGSHGCGQLAVRGGDGSRTLILRSAEDCRNGQAPSPLVESDRIWLCFPYYFGFDLWHDIVTAKRGEKDETPGLFNGFHRCGSDRCQWSVAGHRHHVQARSHRRNVREFF